MTSVTIIGGRGRIGAGLARRWARAGHEVRVATRTPGASSEPGTRAVPLAEVDGSEFVVLSLPQDAATEWLRCHGPQLTPSQTLLDVTLDLRADRTTIALTDRHARLVGGRCAYVAGLQTVSWRALSVEGPAAVDAMVFGDHAAGKMAAIRWLADAGITAHDVGGLDVAPLVAGVADLLMRVDAEAAGTRVLGMRVLHGARG